MILRPKYLLSALAVPLAALVVAGCGGGMGKSGTSATGTGGTATLNVAKTNLGNVLVDAQGRTLYLFEKDAGSKSSCFGECANDWPPARVSAKPSVGNGLMVARLATTSRPDGKPELTYNGHPLYRFEGDRRPGDTTGQGVNAFGGEWYAVSANGGEVSGAAAPAMTGTGGY